MSLSPLYEALSLVAEGLLGEAVAGWKHITFVNGLARPAGAGAACRFTTPACARTGGWIHVEQANPLAARASLSARDDGRSGHLVVGGPEVEIVVLEERDLGNRARIGGDPAVFRQDAGMEIRR